LLQAFTHLVLLAGGTGITPMYQIASAALRNAANKTHVTLLSFSKHDQDACLYQELIDLQVQAVHRHHSTPSSSVAAPVSSPLNLKFLAGELSADAREGFVKGSVRSLNAQQLFELIGAPVSETTVFCMCGPRDWITATQSLLKHGGVHDSQMLAWV
jgi:NAD(P)H-flavin reductase